MSKRLLFLCSGNKLRSPTAEDLFSGRDGIEVESAGLNHDADVPVSPEQLEWADLILVMEKEYRTRLNRRFSEHLAGKRVVVLGIPDNYRYMQPELIEILERKCANYLR